MATSWMRSRRLARAWRAMRSASSCCSRSRSRGWRRGTRARAGGSSPERPLGDVERDLQPGAAVQRPGSRSSSTQLAAASRRWPSTTIASRSSLDPAPQPGPLAQQRLVGQLDGRHPGLGMAVEGQQPGLGPPVDGRVGGRVTVAIAGHLGAGDAAARGLTLGADDDEPLEHLPHRRPLGVVEGAVQQLGPRRRWRRRPRPARGRRPASGVCPGFVRPARTA